MFKNHEVILKQEILLFNNLASNDTCFGRLTATLKVHPILRIVWDFESVGNEACFPAMEKNNKLQNDFSGYDFHLYGSFGGGSSVEWKEEHVLRKVNLQGVSAKAQLGKEINDFDYFQFFLPNARFLHRSYEGRSLESQYRIKHQVGEKPDLKGAIPNSVEMNSWECLIQDDLAIQINSGVNDDWFRSQGAFGTFLTANCSIVPVAKERGSGWYSFEKIKNIVEQICWLFSFANGGYLGPVIIQAGTPLEDELVEIGVYRTTPIEILGETWVTGETNLNQFLFCFSSFQKMICEDAWNADLFRLILIWYFQAIQPSSGQESSKPWPVVANALGAALERLSIAILRDEFGEEPGKKLRQKISNLLRKIGLKNNEDHSFAKIFAMTRNNSTHPDIQGEYSREEMFLSIDYAIQWIEEILLWRLGYDGAYRRRIPGSNRFAFEKPRYDLRTRKSDW